MNLPKLQALSFSGCDGIGDGLVDAIANLTSLRKLNISVTGASAATVRAFLEQAQKLPDEKFCLIAGRHVVEEALFHEIPPNLIITHPN